MKTKDYLIFSRWMRYEDSHLNRIIQEFKNSKGIPTQFRERIVGINVTEKIVANSWGESYKLGQIGKVTKAFYYFIQLNLESLNDNQVVALDSFWVGFLSGQDARKEKWF